jgi:acyl phosphate:glycerol-3-phosphate acyltransferase
VPLLAASIALVVAAYLVGSINPAILIARARGIDIRAEGSGNPGATNAERVLGKKTGRLIMALDLSKGLVPSLIATLWLGIESPYTAATACAATLGHVLPIWHRFRGGKGAATAGGALIGTVPVAGLSALAAYVLLRKTTGYSSLGSLGGAFAGAAVAIAWTHASPVPSAMAGGIFTIVVLRHLSNIRRLFRGEEPRT